MRTEFIFGTYSENGQDIFFILTFGVVLLYFPCGPSILRRHCTFRGKGLILLADCVLRFFFGIFKNSGIYICVESYFWC